MLEFERGANATRDSSIFKVIGAYRIKLPCQGRGNLLCRVFGVTFSDAGLRQRMDEIAQLQRDLQAPDCSHVTISRFLNGSGVGCGIECWHLRDDSLARREIEI
jgi:hypothetical protein